MRWLGFMAGAMLATLSPARAQVPPEAAEAARYSGLHAAAHRGDVTEIRKGGNVDARDAYGRTPLHVATFARQRVAIRALVHAGADLHLLENDRYDGTALIAAAHLGHDGVVRQLIAAGAPLDHVNNLHWTALIEAIVLGDGGRRHQDTLRALIAAGANLRLADRQGRTPLTLARGRGYGAMVRMLEQAGAR
jgi:ankyrin repeat protein